jgi:hypothetical protein
MTQLLAADGADNDGFGASATISKDASTIVVGAVGVDFNTNIANSGAAYLFQITNSTTTTTEVEWTQVAKFVAADREAADGLGQSVAIENNIVAVGAGGDDSSTGLTDVGSVYIFDSEFSETMTNAPTVELTLAATPEPTHSPTNHPTIPPTGSDNNDSTPQTPTDSSQANNSTRQY